MHEIYDQLPDETKTRIDAIAEREGTSREIALGMIIFAGIGKLEADGSILAGKTQIDIGALRPAS